MSSLINFFLNNKEWIFSGIGLLAVTAMVAIWRSLQHRKTVISVFQENGTIYLHNGGKATIDLNFVSFTLKDILSPKGLTRPMEPVLYRTIERPIQPGENIKLVEMGQTLCEKIAAYTKVDRRAFRAQNPGIECPVLLGLDITIDYSMIGSRIIKRKKIERMLSGYLNHGLIIKKHPYGKDSTIPTRIRIKERLSKFMQPLKDLPGWYEHRKCMRLVQAKLDVNSIIRALHYEVIDDENAKFRIRTLLNSLDENQRESLREYTKQYLDLDLNHLR